MNMQKQAGVWGKIKRLWHKWRGKGEFEDPTAAESKVVNKLAENLSAATQAQASPFIRAVVEMTNKHQLPAEYLQYVFWLIAENSRNWPRMSDRYNGVLALGRDLVIGEGKMPNYRDGLKVPPPEYEETVDKVIEWVAFWVSAKMKATLLKVYLADLKFLAQRMQKVLGDRLPADKALPYLKALFEEELSRNPRQFPGGDLLDRVIFTLFR